MLFSIRSDAGIRWKRLPAGWDWEGDRLVLTMERRQREKVLEKFEEADPGNVYVLTEFVGDELEIVNPYGGTLQMYGLCYETVLTSIHKLAAILNEGK